MGRTTAARRHRRRHTTTPAPLPRGKPLLLHVPPRRWHPLRGACRLTRKRRPLRSVRERMGPLLDGTAHLFAGHPNRALAIWTDQAAGLGSADIQGCIGQILVVGLLGRSTEAIALVDGTISFGPSPRRPLARGPRLQRRRLRLRTRRSRSRPRLVPPTTARERLRRRYAVHPSGRPKQAEKPHRSRCATATPNSPSTSTTAPSSCTTSAATASPPPRRSAPRPHFQRSRAARHRRDPPRRRCSTPPRVTPTRWSGCGEPARPRQLRTPLRAAPPMTSPKLRGSPATTSRPLDADATPAHRRRDPPSIANATGRART